MSVNRDALVAIFFLLLCAVMYTATYSLPEAMFGQLAPSTWPRIILIPLAVLSALLLVKSQRSGTAPAKGPGKNVREWLEYYKNPIICFFLFFLFLVAMPYLGMLLGGLVYVFLTLCVLGGWQPRQVGLHAMISAVFVIGMWAIFTQLLGVFLPEGVILKVY